MFFTKFGRIVAWLIFMTALLQFLAGFSILFGTETMEDNRNAAQHYFNEPNSGAILNDAQFYLFVAIALGIATEISRNIHKIWFDGEEDEGEIDEDG